MRVVGGRFKGRKLSSFDGDAIRPTTDKVREAIFNVLGVPFQFKKVLDLFAGSGALGIEALSRGAEEALFVDMSRESVKVIEDNLNACKIGKEAKVLKKPVLSAIAELKEDSGFDLVFLDAPYKDIDATKEALKLLSKTQALTNDCLLVCEISSRETLDEDFLKESGLEALKEKKYGDSAVYFLERK